jgi:Flp pilus assembly protein protease CpaA
MSLPIWLTLGACFIAGISDLHSRRIPNWLTGTLAVAALVVHAFDGLWPLATCFAVLAAGIVAGTLIYSRGGIGAGDVKLAIAGSAMLSWPLCVSFLLYTAISGGVLALITLATKASGRVAISRAIYLTLAGAPGIATDKREKLPYALAFVLGAILVALSVGAAPFLRINI